MCWFTLYCIGILFRKFRDFFSRITLKDIVAVIKKSRLIQYAAEEFLNFPRVSFPQNIASAKFCKNKTIAKNSEFTVL